jgi:hypothetical protein
MYQTTIWHDVTTAVDHAVREHLDRLPEVMLMQHSDGLLARLPGVGGARLVTTSAFLQHYHVTLHDELCRGTHPHSVAATAAGQLHDLTRAVLVSGAAEGMSIEAAVGIALVLYKRGVMPFCAQPRLHLQTV